MTTPATRSFGLLALALAPASLANAQAPGGHSLTIQELRDSHIGSGAGYFAPSQSDPVAHWGASLNLAGRDPDKSLLVVASNGGGDRARFVTLGVYDLLMQVGLWSEVDGLSTVSGSSAAAVSALAASTPGSPKVAPSGTVGIVTEHPAKGDLAFLIFAPAALQETAALEKMLPEFARTWASAEYKPGLTEAPLWIPNASTAQAGERVPLTNDSVGRRDGTSLHPAWLAYLSSAVPGVMPPGAVMLSDRRNGEKGDRWLVDGAWADRWGVITGTELALAAWSGVTPETKRMVLVVDSRPSPISDGRDAHFEEAYLRDAGARGQLIGYSIEQTRLGTDSLYGRAIFGPSSCVGANSKTVPMWSASSCKQGAAGGVDTAVDEIAKVLAHEGFSYYPPVYGAASTVTQGTAQAALQRVGADTLLQPALWDKAKITPQCARTAARLHSVIAVQPTDFALRAPMRREGWRPVGEPGKDGENGYVTSFYPYGSCADEDGGAQCKRDERAAALAMAGAFSLWLRMEAVRAAAGISENPAEDAQKDAQALWSMGEALNGHMNWRSWQAYTDFSVCVQQGAQQSLRYAKLPKVVEDPLLDSHTLRVPALHYAQVHPYPCPGDECKGYALPPIVRVKGGDGGEAKGAEQSDPKWSAVEYCVKPRLDPAKTLNDHFDAEGGPKTRRPDSDRQKDPKSCPDR